MKNSSEERSDNWIIEKAIQIISKYPLCDSCLGRCFARLGYGLENKERGRSIKILIMLYLDSKIKNHQISDLSVIKEISQNLGNIAEKWFHLYFSEEFQTRKCYICEDEIDNIKHDFMEKSLKILNNMKNRRYVLGVELDENTKKRENKIIQEFGLSYYESIKHEIKREVGKTLAEKGFPPYIENPDVEIVYKLTTKDITVIEKSVKTFYVYNRLSRNVPISSWYSKQKKGLDTLLGKKILFSLSEPSNVRILTEYPLIIQDETRDRIKLEGYNILKVMEIGKKELEVISTSKPTMKKYRVTVYSQRLIEGSIPLYGNIYDVYVNVKSFEELKNEINKLQTEYNAIILSIDLVDIEGKIKRIIETYVKSFNL